MSQNIKFTSNHNLDNSNLQAQDEGVDIKYIVAIFLQSRYLFAISIVVCLALAFLYSKIAQSNWHIYSKILVKDAKNSPQSALAGTLTGDIGSVFNVKSSADNEIQILKSRSLMFNTVKQMQLNVKTFRKNGLETNEIYDEAPFECKLVYIADTLKKRTYNIEIINASEFRISNGKEDVDKIVKFGTPIKLQQYFLTLKKVFRKNYSKSYRISIETPDATVDAFAKAFSANLSDKQATTIDLALSYPNPRKGEAILNTIMHLYLLSNLQNEVQIADSTMKFIDSRIALVSKELNGIEKQFERYKTQNKIVNISEQSKVLVSSASEYNNKLIEQEIQLSVIKDLETYLSNPSNKKAIPSSLIVNTPDQSFGQSINAYNELLVNREKAGLSYTETNPVVRNLDNQINSSRQSILKNVESYRKALVSARNQLKKENISFEGELSQIPQKERNYLDFARQQNLKQELYLFLLQKREETAITKTSTISSSRIIDFAKGEFLPYSPKSSLIYIIGLLSGLILPIIYLFLKEILNFRIDTKSDIEKATKASIIGEIGHNSDKQSLVAGNNSRSVISEQFRSLRTNLQFVLNSSKSNVLLFTSSMSGEGKSFLSLNIGSALALTGKKVVFMEMDLRKPKLSESVGLSIENGFTNYAISEGASYDYKKLLKPLSFSKNCFLISSGPIPPNPAELLINGKLEKLIDYLKEEFDYIIIDCAPIGLVTDALMLERYANSTLFVVRQGFTYKSQLAIVNDLIISNKVKSLYLIVNDIKAQKAGYSTYKQAYGYGIEEEESFFSKFKFWKNK